MAKRKTSTKKRAARKAPKRRRAAAAPKSKSNPRRRRAPRARARRSNPAGIGLPAIVVNPSGPRTSNPRRKRRRNPRVETSAAYQKRINKPSRRRATRRRGNPGGKINLTGLAIGLGLTGLGAVGGVVAHRLLQKYGPVMSTTTTALVEGGGGLASGVAMAALGGGYGAAFGAGFAGALLVPAGTQLVDKLMPSSATAPAPAMGALRARNMLLGAGYAPRQFPAQMAPAFVSADEVRGGGYF